MTDIKKLLVLSSGGDAPGMNAAIRAVVRTALFEEIEVFGAMGGYQGLVDQDIQPLGANSVANCIQRGGTILKTGRCEDFFNADVREQTLNHLNKVGIDSLIVLGGNGSFAGAASLASSDKIKVIGIPCTIDNDIQGTEYCIGFDTARNTALEAIDKIRDTASSINRNFIIEVMGRESGFLAVDVGIAGGAEIIIIPEIPITPEKLVKRLEHRRRAKLASIIVAAEAGEPGSSIKLAKAIKKLSGIEYKVCILGHTQRGGTPTAQDRVIGSLMGRHAVQALLDGASCQMVSLTANKIKMVDFAKPEQGTRFFSDTELVHMNEMICDI